MGRKGKRHWMDGDEWGKLDIATFGPVHLPTQSIRTHTPKIRKKAIQTQMKPSRNEQKELKNTQPRVGKHEEKKKKEWWLISVNG